jgi:hypothetical protein
MGIPGHFARCEFIGDVKHVHTGVHGRITAILLHVHVGTEAMEIAVIMEQAAAARGVRRERMIDQVVEEGIQQAIAKTLLGQMSGDVVERLLQELWARHREALESQALETVRREHQRELEGLKERVRDEAARERKQLEHELENELDQRWNAEQHRLDEEMGDRIARLKQARNAWKGRAERAERLLAGLLLQLLEEGRKTYVHDCGLRQWSVYELNEVLALFGWRIRSEARPTERSVLTQLKPDAAPVPRAVFWVERCNPEAPTIIDDEEDDEETAETPPALPAAESGA